MVRSLLPPVLSAVAFASLACEGVVGTSSPSQDGPPIVFGSSAASTSAPGAGSALPSTGAIDTSAGSGDPSVAAAVDTGAGSSSEAQSTGGGVAPGSGSGVAEQSGASGAAPGEEVAQQLPPFEPAPGTLRRLTRTQFRNAVRDVFGVTVDVAELDGDSWTGDFAVIGAATVVTSARGVEQYHAAIEGAADAVFSDPLRLAAFTGCTPSPSAGDACVQRFVEQLGRRAWRRPLDPTEVARFQALAESATLELSDPDAGLRWVTIALFTSPNFLYRAELGEDAAAGATRLSGFELASRLAFSLWNSVPDDALLDDAAQGVLDTPEGVRTAATRLLDAPAGREAVGAFAEEYMRLDRIRTQAKDATLFPEYGPALQAAMVRDMRETWQAVTFDEQASLLDLFSTRHVVVNSELALLYGLDPSGLDAETFEARILPADSPRVGILGKAGFLSQFANQKEGSPTLRGKFMRQALTCTKVPSPPGDADVVLDEPPADMPMTKRERLELHRTSPACAACHSLMDPLGLPFESFDAIGRYRTAEHGLAIDPSGEFDGQLVRDSRELGFTLAESEAVANCLVRKYYSYAQGFEERSADAVVLEQLTSSFAASGHRLRELILDVVTHEAFASVAPQTEPDPAP